MLHLPHLECDVTIHSLQSNLGESSRSSTPAQQTKLQFQFIQLNVISALHACILTVRHTQAKIVQRLPVRKRFLNGTFTPIVWRIIVVF